jgi:hypothetical protein
MCNQVEVPTYYKTYNKPQSGLLRIPLANCKDINHKIHIFLEYPVPQCLSPRLNWDSPTPSTASECVPPLGTKMGEGVNTLACV